MSSVKKTKSDVGSVLDRKYPTEQMANDIDKLNESLSKKTQKLQAMLSQSIENMISERDYQPSPGQQIAVQAFLQKSEIESRRQRSSEDANNAINSVPQITKFQITHQSSTFNSSIHSKQKRVSKGDKQNIVKRLSIEDVSRDRSPAPGRVTGPLDLRLSKDILDNQVDTVNKTAIHESSSPRLASFTGIKETKGSFELQMDGQQTNELPERGRTSSFNDPATPKLSQDTIVSNKEIIVTKESDIVQIQKSQPSIFCDSNIIMSRDISPMETQPSKQTSQARISSFNEDYDSTQRFKPIIFDPKKFERKHTKLAAKPFEVQENRLNRLSVDAEDRKQGFDGDSIEGPHKKRRTRKKLKVSVYKSSDAGSLRNSTDEAPVMRTTGSIENRAKTCKFCRSITYDDSTRICCRGAQNSPMIKMKTVKNYVDLMKKKNKVVPSPKQVFKTNTSAATKRKRRSSQERNQSSEYLPMIREPKKNGNKTRNVARSGQFRSIQDATSIQKFLKGPNRAVQDSIMNSSILREAKISTRGSRLHTHDGEKPITPMGLTYSIYNEGRASNNSKQQMLKTMEFQTHRIKSDLERPNAPQAPSVMTTSIEVETSKMQKKQSDKAAAAKKRDKRGQSV